jgi:hypothetical protein
MDAKTLWEGFEKDAVVPGFGAAMTGANMAKNWLFPKPKPPAQVPSKMPMVRGDDGTPVVDPKVWQQAQANSPTKYRMGGLDMLQTQQALRPRTGQEWSQLTPGQQDTYSNLRSLVAQGTKPVRANDQEFLRLAAGAPLRIGAPGPSQAKGPMQFSMREGVTPDQISTAIQDHFGGMLSVPTELWGYKGKENLNPSEMNHLYSTLRAHGMPEETMKKYINISRGPTQPPPVSPSGQPVVTPTQAAQANVGVGGVPQGSMWQQIMQTLMPYLKPFQNAWGQASQGNWGKAWNTLPGYGKAALIGLPLAGMAYGMMGRRPQLRYGYPMGYGYR